MSTALLLLDLQCDFLQRDGRFPVGEAPTDAVLRCVGTLLANAAAAGLVPVFITNQFPPSDRIGNFLRRQAAVRGTPGTALDPRVEARGHPVFPKERADAFTNPQLAAFLRDRHVTSLVIAGIFAEGCVRATALGGRRRGFTVTAVTDGIASDRAWKTRFACWSMRRGGVRLATCAELLAER